MRLVAVSRTRATLAFDSCPPMTLPLASACSALGLPCTGPRSARLAMILHRLGQSYGLRRAPIHRRVQSLTRAHLDALAAESISHPA